jgi:hypothetical protein
MLLVSPFAVSRDADHRIVHRVRGCMHFWRSPQLVQNDSTLDTARTFNSGLEWRQCREKHVEEAVNGVNCQEEKSSCGAWLTKSRDVGREHSWVVSRLKKEPKQLWSLVNKIERCRSRIQSDGVMSQERTKAAMKLG